MAEILNPYTPERSLAPSSFEHSQLEIEHVLEKEAAGSATVESIFKRINYTEDRENWGANARRLGAFALADERLTGVLEGMQETSRPLDYVTELTRNDKLAHATEADTWTERRFRANPDLPRDTYRGMVEVYIADALDDIRDSIRGEAPPAHEAWQWDIRQAVRNLKTAQAAEPEAPTQTPTAVSAERRRRAEQRIELSAEPEKAVSQTITYLNRWEAMAADRKLKFDEFAKEEFNELYAAIQELPDRLGERNETLSILLRKDVFLKEKLGLLVEARRRLSDRTTEIVTANGGFQAMGTAVRGESGLQTLDYKVTNLTPTDFWVLIHHDELFRSEGRNIDSRELHTNVAQAMSFWQALGEAYDQRLPGDHSYFLRDNLPSFKKALQSAENLEQLRAAVRTKVGQKAEMLAWNIFTCTLTIDMWDHDRAKHSGKNDPRDLMYIDFKRRSDFVNKIKSAGPDNTIGRYFSRPDQGEGAARGVTDTGAWWDHVGEDLSPEARLSLLKQNRNRAVFKLQSDQLSGGEVIADFWHTATVRTRGENSKQMIQIAREQGWKAIHFFGMEAESYDSYFTYLMIMANGVGESVRKRDWDVVKDGLTTRNFWQKMGIDHFGKLKDYCPHINTLSPAEQDRAIAEFKKTFVLGVLWDGSYLTKPVKPVVGVNPFTRILAKTANTLERKGNFSNTEYKNIMAAIVDGQFLTLSQIREMQDEIDTFNFRRKGFNEMRRR